MTIKILNQDLINKIAAGEVVERPASVVKELVENSLDSGAWHITIEVQNGGIDLIRVIDDGCGMDQQDAELCLSDHATSKISNIEDLYQVKTFGFRGEALSSISSVSKFSLTTKRETDILAIKVSFSEGVISKEVVSGNSGTTVEVKDLFYNLPVRKKYLKLPATEYNHIVDLFFSYALGYPQIAWKLISNGKPAYSFPVTDWQVRLADVLGENIGENLLRVDRKLNGLSFSGFIGKPQIARNNKKLQYLYVNGRPVGEFIIAKQVKEAYSTLLMRDSYPVFILNLQINNEAVDVNVHPRKLEVRFSEPQLIYKTVYEVVARTLDEQDLQTTVKIPVSGNFSTVGQVLTKKNIPNLSAEKKEQFLSQPKLSSFANESSKQDKLSLVDFEKSFVNNQENLIKQEEPAFLENKKDDPFIPEYKIWGQIQNSYILVETENGLKIYDQHASSERVQYEKIKKEWFSGKLSGQRLLIPQTVDFSLIEARLLNIHNDFFEKLGFEITHFGGNSFVLNSIPQLFVDEDYREIVKEIVGSLDEEFVFDSEINEKVENVIKMMACKSAIKFGDLLTEKGMEALINDLERLSNSYTCVHGRPCHIEFSYKDLAKLFKRTN